MIASIDFEAIFTGDCGLLRLPAAASASPKVAASQARVSWADLHAAFGR